MTTREEYSFLAHMAHCEYDASLEPIWQERWRTIERVLRQLAEGAVLCEKVTQPNAYGKGYDLFLPIEEQPC